MLPLPGFCVFTEPRLETRRVGVPHDLRYRVCLCKHNVSSTEATRRRRPSALLQRSIYLLPTFYQLSGPCNQLTPGVRAHRVRTQRGGRGSHQGHGRHRVPREEDPHVSAERTRSGHLGRAEKRGGDWQLVRIGKKLTPATSRLPRLQPVGAVVVRRHVVVSARSRLAVGSFR